MSEGLIEKVPSSSSGIPAPSPLNDENNTATTPTTNAFPNSTSYTSLTQTPPSLLTRNTSTLSEKNLLETVRKLALRNKGEFRCSNVQWAFGLDDDKLKNNKHVSIKTLLNNSFHWNFVKLFVSAEGKITAGNSLLIVSEIQECGIDIFNFDLVVKLTPKISPTKSYFFKFNNFNDYLEFLACLMSWHGLKQKGLVSKWNYNNSIIYNENLKPNEIIVCRFKIYGPLPLSNAKVHIYENGPENPVYPTPTDSNVKEGWFSVIGHLLPTGILNLVSELDGTLLYSINITLLFNSEIRILHNSILQNSNVLFLGFIDVLRENHNLHPSSFSEFIQDKHFKNVNRILIDFDLRIDLEDWFVALSSFTKLEYVGNQFTGNHLKISDELSLEIMEAQFQLDNHSMVNGANPNFANSLKNSCLYCELILWNTPWFRSAIVKTDSHASTFWKELINLKLPISNSNDFKILIKKAKSTESYNIDGENSDEIIGTCFVNSDLFNEVQFLQKIPIHNLQNKLVGKLMINLSKVETVILPFQKYKSLENILMNSKIEPLISYLEPKSSTSTLESWSIMLLDIYQSLNKEDEYFETLMKYELSPIDSLASSSLNDTLHLQNSHSDTNINNNGGSSNNNGSVTNSSNNFRYHTIFRGNSMLSKSLEKYTVRVGHEYLEKLLGKFIEKVRVEDLNCECDPKIEPETYQENYRNLLRYVEYLWNRIYKTTNDIPSSIKNQWKNLRQNVELSVDPNDKETPLNALSSFIFLRFLCPAILSPKLYNLSKTHYSGKISRTLVLIAKVLMTFSNRSKFQKHREPYLIPLNEDFLEKHQDEILIYFDKVTFRKMDFNERLLDMSNIVDRIQLNTSKAILNELPTMPFLIDKYLNIAKLVELLSKFYQAEKEEAGPEKEAFGKYQIEGFDDTGLEDDFLTSLINDENNALNSLLSKHEFSLKDLKKQSIVLLRETKSLESQLLEPEYPSIIADSWEEYIACLIRSCRLKIVTTGFSNNMTMVRSSESDGSVVFDSDLFHNSKLQFNEDNLTKLNTFLTSLMIQNEKTKLNKSTMITNRSGSAVSASQFHENGNGTPEAKPKIKLGKKTSDGDDSGKKKTLFRNIFKRGKN